MKFNVAKRRPVCFFKRRFSK